jgi:hypothetical protein
MKLCRIHSYGVMGMCIALSSGCAGEAGSRLERVEVEVLPGGGMHVRNPAQGEWERSGEQPWRLVRDLRIGEADGDSPYVFGQVRAIIPVEGGGFWMQDSRFVELRLFDHEGRWVRSIGGPGDGPGEFDARGGSSCVVAGPNREIWVSDMRSRLQRFDQDGTLLDDRVVPEIRFCRTAVMRDGGIVTLGGSGDGPTRARAIPHLLGESGELIAGDTFDVELPMPEMVLDRQGNILDAYPFSPGLGFTFIPGGSYLSAEFGSYRFQLRTMEGDTVLIVEREYEPVPIPAEIRDRAVEDFLLLGERVIEWGEDVDASAFSADRVPQVYPPFLQLRPGGDGTSWAARVLESGEDGFDLFDENGLFLGSVASPLSFAEAGIRALTPEHIFVVVPDDLGVPYIERWSIER